MAGAHDTVSVVPPAPDGVLRLGDADVVPADADAVVRGIGVPIQHSRTVVVEPRNPPWRKICLLDIVWDDGGRRGRGTGFFAGARTIMTAGHCVYDPSRGGWANRIIATPACDGMSAPFGTYYAAKMFTVAGWQNDHADDFDYGAIVLDQAIGSQVGWFALAAFADADLLNLQVNVAGYPVDQHPDRTMWRSADVIRSVTAHRLGYDAVTSPGESGGPVFGYRSGTDERVVAVHTDGSGGHALGTRITTDAIHNIEVWSAAT